MIAFFVGLCCIACILDMISCATTGDERDNNRVLWALRLLAVASMAAVLLQMLAGS